MAYQVYLIEPFNQDNWIELDCENVDFTTIFSVADVSDISKRKDKITKQIAFKGSSTNNQAFGSLFFQNQVADFDLSNRLFFNYNPLRTVDCLVYEDSVLLLRGSLRVLEVNVDKNSNVIYQTVVTGAFIDFRDIVSEKLLDDLDFSDLRHQYKWTTIRQSWEQRTQRAGATSTTYSFKPFKKGDGYVYPFIDYGVWFKKTTELPDPNKINIENFRPAIYVREYFNRIFQQPELSGYSYEVKGDQELVDKFDSLIVPNNVEKIINKSTGMSVKAFSTTAPVGRNINRHFYGGQGPYYFARNIQLSSLVNPQNMLDWYGSVLGENGTVFLVNRTFTSNGYCKLTLNNVSSLTALPMRITVQLCRRDFLSAASGDFSNGDTWQVVASKTLPLNGNSSLPPNTVVEFEVGERKWEANEQLTLRLHVECDNSLLLIEALTGTMVTYSYSDGLIRFPKDDNGTITYEVKEGDAITPKPVEGIKQMDFIKAVLNLFNLYVYTTKDRPKHLVFQTYNDYYAFTQPHVLASNAVDWTGKIDFSQGLKIKSNVSIPKKYLFSFKEDGDYYNNLYKKNWNEVYGTFRFTDSYGLDNEKKVESIFSPSPLLSPVGSKRIHPAILQIENNLKKPVKSNIRILYYNGVKGCAPYLVGKDIISNNTQEIQWLTIPHVNTYAQVGNYLLESGPNNHNPKEDLYWGLAKEVYFDILPAHQNCPTAYNNFYRGQITDLTNPNVSLIQCEVNLNEVDIANLDLRVPVFVDLGEFGHSYYRVLSIEYENNNTTSRCVLQKIVI